MPILAQNVPLMSPVFLNRFLVFPILFHFSVALHCSFEKAFLSLLAILCYSTFNWVYLSLSLFPFAPFLFSAICKTSSDNHVAFLHFFFFGMVSLPPVQCYQPLSIVLQALCLPDLTPWIYSSPPLYNHKRFDLCHLNDLVVFPTFFNLSLIFTISNWWSEPQSTPSFVLLTL